MSAVIAYNDTAAKILLRTERCKFYSWLGGDLGLYLPSLNWPNI